MRVPETRADVPIRCACGTMRGVLRGVSPASGNRAVCYCDDCQSFAHYLGHPEAVLDAHGGTEVFQTSSARFEITAGSDRLACMRLRPNGMFRWYASCCRTPLGNTLPTGRLPFFAAMRSCIAADAAETDAILGAVRARVMGRFAIGDTAGLDIHKRAPISMIARVAGMLLAARLRGDHKRSMFFSVQTGEPAAAPAVLTADELREVERARDASAAGLARPYQDPGRPQA